MQQKLEIRTDSHIEPTVIIIATASIAYEYELMH